jgi:glycine dehydrogenase
MMGGAGLTRATQVAILNANYMAERLAPHYPVLYRGAHGRVAPRVHPRLRPLQEVGRDRGRGHRQAPDGLRLPRADDVVPGAGHADGRADRERAQGRARSLLRRDDRDPRTRSPRSRAGRWTRPTTRSSAPHTAAAVTATEWGRSYSREQAAFPAPWLREHKYWPPVARVDNAYGDRHLVCSCPPSGLLIRSARVAVAPSHGHRAGGPGGWRARRRPGRRSRGARGRWATPAAAPRGARGCAR